MSCMHSNTEKLICGSKSLQTHSLHHPNYKIQHIKVQHQSRTRFSPRIAPGRKDIRREKYLKATAQMLEKQRQRAVLSNLYQKVKKLQRRTAFLCISSIKKNLAAGIARSMSVVEFCHLSVSISRARLSLPSYSHVTDPCSPTITRASPLLSLPNYSADWLTY